MTVYMFSESAGLLCKVKNGNKYEVLNGGWTGTRHGDSFIVYEGRELTIVDWEEVDPEKMSKDWQREWYYI